MTLTTELDITRKRGDTYPIKLTITSDGTALPLTDYTFKLTVDRSPYPKDDSKNLFSVTGTITDAAAGKFEFRPSVEQMSQTPGVYFYDVQMTDAAGFIATIAKGKFTIEQDITK